MGRFNEFLQTNYINLTTIYQSVYLELFPSFLKPLAWLKSDNLHLYTTSILPSIIILNADTYLNNSQIFDGNNPIIELFHRIVDLPFTTLVLEI